MDIVMRSYMFITTGGKRVIIFFISVFNSLLFIFST